MTPSVASTIFLCTYALLESTCSAYTFHTPSLVTSFNTASRINKISSPLYASQRDEAECDSTVDLETRNIRLKAPLSALVSAFSASSLSAIANAEESPTGLISPLELQTAPAPVPAPVVVPPPAPVAVVPAPVAVVPPPAPVAVAPPPPVVVVPAPAPVVTVPSPVVAPAPVSVPVPEINLTPASEAAIAVGTVALLGIATTTGRNQELSAKLTEAAKQAEAQSAEKKEFFKEMIEKSAAEQAAARQAAMLEVTMAPEPEPVIEEQFVPPPVVETPPPPPQPPVATPPQAPFSLTGGAPPSKPKSSGRFNGSSDYLSNL
eukprot:CAMPEP_0178955786 /NCGR_PEP_ID=MMETSP0789-20121207/9820_1 /TAXON_ID=3005 /ORGANISM="Rhizosolenia setigera, Strain CCMP 1694" /LENGTH=318 /DNA_ID=CAMNT_0020637499 /DNA_START=172 /DNA_END=1128 /DNA_ORIENTATION=-